MTVGLYSVEQKFHTEYEKNKESWIWARAPKKCAPCFRGTRNFLFIGNYIGFQKSEKILRFLKFDILRVPPIQIPTKNG
jgi:hypothetical protein